MKRNQNDYTGFTQEQFAADEYFQQWVLQDDGDLGEFWESYLLLHPRQEETLRNARRLVKDLDTNGFGSEPLTREEKEVIKYNIFRGLQLPLSAGRDTFHTGKEKTWLRSLAAAAVLVVIAIPLYFLLKPADHAGGRAENDVAARTVTTNPNEMKRIALEDGTIILLNAGSSLRYGADFKDGSTREVFLEGNAFFDVKRNARQAPFIVHTRSLAVTVLGTELNVNARSAETEVELTKGKVKVEQAGNGKSATYLQPGDKVKLNVVSQALIKTRTDARLYAAWTEGKWNFRQTTLEQIAGLIREYYGVEIFFKNEKVRASRIDAVIPVSGLQSLVTVIERTLQVKMELTNNRLIIE